MQEYLMHWWAGDLAIHYHPFGLSMEQFYKLVKASQYATALLGVFEIFHYSAVMRKFHSITMIHFVLNRLPWAMVSLSVTLVPKMCTGLIAVTKKELALTDLLRSMIFPHLTAKIKEVEERAKDARVVRWFLWLADHPLSNTSRRFFVFTAFALLSLLELFTF